MSLHRWAVSLPCPLTRAMRAMRASELTAQRYPLTSLGPGLAVNAVMTESRKVS
jgi:hypothetical protein